MAKKNYVLTILLTILVIYSSGCAKKQHTTEIDTNVKSENHIVSGECIYVLTPADIRYTHRISLPQFKSVWGKSAGMGIPTTIYSSETTISDTISEIIVNSLTSSGYKAIPIKSDEEVSSCGSNPKMIKPTIHQFWVDGAVTPLSIYVVTVNFLVILESYDVKNSTKLNEFEVRVYNKNFRGSSFSNKGIVEKTETVFSDNIEKLKYELLNKLKSEFL